MPAEGSTIPDARYLSTAGAPPGIQVIETADITDRVKTRGLDPHKPSRLAFHLLIGVCSGNIECAVDFVPYTIRAGEWLWIKPSQVHEYLCDLQTSDGIAILFAPGFPDRETARIAGVDDPLRQQVWRGDSDMRDRLEMLTETLRREYASLGDAPLEVHVFTLRHLLSALLLMFSAHESGAIRPSSPIFEAFRRAVEDEFRTLHHVQDYANRLRYSTRTLTRVVTAATGRGAKQYIDDRVLLEAKRILAHTDMTVNTIAKQLGFPTSTDFARFFRFRMGVTPARFRDLTQVRAAGGASQPKNAAASS